MWGVRGWVGLLLAGCLSLVDSKCPSVPQGTTKLVCFYEGRKDVAAVDPCSCTHLVYTGEARGEELETISKKMLEKKPKLKFLLRTNGKEKDLAELMKSSTVHGFNLHEAHAALNRSKISSAADQLRSAAGSDALIVLSLPAQSELLAKYYDLKALLKPVNLFSLETHQLGGAEKQTFHPSRLSGTWDMLNTDSVVDLAIGLGVPVSRLIITAPAHALRFTLTNSTLSTPGSPSKDAPEKLDQAALCSLLGTGEKWTLERDQDLSAPYAFKEEKWVAFEDATSLDVKGKYARIRGLAGLGLVAVDDDSKTTCGDGLLAGLAKTLGTQARAPRGALLSSLEHDILSVPHSNRLADAVQLSPYRISRVVDSDGVIHALREDTRTEFSCQRQGYFVHPRSCNRFYRCVKFDQLSEEFTVFEFDCPAGLAFDGRYEVCVWPGSLSHGQACPGSSEIAPVPETRFVCPETPGYYADPANCRWFFACLDHGKSPLSAYEFRCPFGLGFDESKLICDWPWLVPGCGNLGKYEASAHGHASATLTGASAYIGASANAVNVAAHNSLISGASTSNLVGIQSGYGSQYNTGELGYSAEGDHSAGNLHYHGSASSPGHGGSFDTAGVAFQGGQYESGAQILSTGYAGPHGGSGYSSSLNAGSGAYNANQGSLSSSSLHSGAGYNAGATYAGTEGYEGESAGSLSSAYFGSSKNQHGTGAGGGAYYGKGYHGGLNGGVSSASFNPGNKYGEGSYQDESGQYRHDSSGDYKHDYSGELSEQAVPYKHIEGAQSPYSGSHDTGSYSGSHDTGSYSGSHDAGSYSGSHDVGSYKGSHDAGSYTGSHDAGSYKGSHDAGLYIGSHDGGSYSGSNDAGSYKGSHDGSYIGSHDAGYYSGSNDAGSYKGSHDFGAYTGSHDGSYIGSHDPGSYSGSSNSGSSGSGAYSGSSKYSGSSDSGAYKGSAQGGAYYGSGNFGSYSGSKSGLYSSSDSGLYSGSSDSGSYSGSDAGVYSGAYNKGAYSGDGKYYGSYNQEAYKGSGAGAVSSQSFHLSSSHSSDGDSGSYHHDNGGSYKEGFVSGAGGEYQHDNSGAYKSAYQYDNSGAYKAGYEYDGSKYQHGYSGGVSVLGAGDANVKDANVNNVYVHHGASSGNTYSSGSNTYSGYATTGAAHTLTAGAINSGLVGKTTLVDADLLYNNGYSQGSTAFGNSGSGYSQSSFVSSTPGSIVSYEQPASVSSHEYQYSGQYNTGAKLVNSLSFSHQPIAVTAAPVIAYKPVPAKTAVTEVFGYQKPAVSYVKPIIVSSTPKTIVYEKQPIRIEQPVVSVSSYSKPVVNVQQTYHGQSEYQRYEPAPSVVTATQSSLPTQYYESHNQYVSSTPKVSVISYQKPSVSTYQNPLIAYKNVTPAPIVSSVASYIKEPTITTYVKPSVSTYQQNYVHKPVAQQTYIQQEYIKAPVVQQSYVQPAVSQQSFHQSSVQHQQYVEKEYPQTYVVSSTAAPIVYEKHTVEYQKPQTYTYKAPEYLPPKTKVVQPVIISSTPAPVKYQQQAIVHTYEPPKYIAPVIASTPAPVFYKKPEIVEYTAPQQSYSFQKYDQPKVSLSQSYESSTSVPINYNQHSIVHTYESPKIVAPLVSSTPAPISYKQPELVDTYSYQAPTYIAPKVSYSQTNYVSSTPAPVKYQQQAVVHTYEAPKIVVPIVSTTPHYETYQKTVEYKAPAVSSYTFEAPKAQYVQPAFVSLSSTPAAVKFEQNYKYESPKIQTYEVPQYSTPKYVQQPIKISTPAPFVYQKPASKIVESFKISSNYDQHGYVSSTAGVPQYTETHYTQSYSTPKVVPSYQSSTYLPPKVELTEEEYIPSVTYKPVTQPPTRTTVYKAPDYLPPTPYAKTVYDNSQISYKYSSPAPVKYVSSTVPTYQAPVSYNVNPIEEFAFEKVAITPKPTIIYKPEPTFIQQIYRPVSTTQRPVTVYKKPQLTVDYSNEKQVNLLGFGTVGPDAGLVTPTIYTPEEPIQYTEKFVVPVTQRIIKTKKIITPTYAPVRQRIVEVTPPVIRKTRPKVAIVTKVNDFNPLIVRKLGAVCSCRSNVLRLRKNKHEPKPDVEYEIEYDNDYDVPVNGDDDEEWTYKSDAYESFTPSAAPVKSANPTVSIAYVPERSTIPIVRKPKITVVSSTLNPIIVPDITGYDEQGYSSNIKSTLQPIVVEEEENYLELQSIPKVSTVKYITRTDAPVRRRLRVKTHEVSIAPTIHTVLIPESETVKSANLIGESRAFDRYGPGGWRGKDETLQGSVDCQRAGLFRHPKHCNKFYSCRWDCTKNRFTLHVFNCPIQLSFDPNMGACNWPSQGPACEGNTLLPSGF